MQPDPPSSLPSEPMPPPPAGQVVDRVWADLQPRPGRWELSWRMAALCALTGAVFMTYQIPLAAIGCYLIFFVLKPEPTESILMAIAVIVLVSVVVALLFLVGNTTLEHPAWRLAIIAATSMLFMYLGVASQVGPVGSIVALVIAFAITLFSIVPVGEALTRGLLYAWLMAATPMAILIVFNLVLGRKPTRLLRRDLAERLRLCAEALEAPDRVGPRLALQAALAESQAELEKRVALLTVFHVRPRTETRYLAQAAEATYQAMLAVAAGLARHPAVAAPATLTEALRDRARALEQGVVPAAGDVPSDLAPEAAADVPAWRGVTRSLARLAGDTTTVSGDVPDKPPFFSADAFTNPDYMRYAIKTTAAALIAYVVYTALDWQDIHTAMITCYVAALATTAETIHKLTLRIAGCLIGASLGIASVHLVMPHMTGVGELMLLLFGVCLLASWVATGPERIAYAGVQIALAFLLTVLQGFGPDPQVSVALDRIWGILLGNFVLFAIFTLIWPASVTTAGERRLRQLASGVHQLAALPVTHERQRTAAAAALLHEVGQIRELLQLAMFEPRAHRPDRATWQRHHQVLDAAPPLIAGLSQADATTVAELLEPVAEWSVTSSAETYGHV